MDLFHSLQSEGNWKDAYLSFMTSVHGEIITNYRSRERNGRMKGNDESEIICT